VNRPSVGRSAASSREETLAEGRPADPSPTGAPEITSRRTTAEPNSREINHDLVGVGRALLADAGWARKVHAGLSSELSGFSKAALATLS
jgi:2,4-dienoyl-CoA reductase-like NADH-dependent reductase (Old Yellow Enzyme family)